MAKGIPLNLIESGYMLIDRINICQELILQFNFCIIYTFLGHCKKNIWSFEIKSVPSIDFKNL